MKPSYVIIAFTLLVCVSSFVPLVDSLSTADSPDSYYGILGLTQSTGRDASVLKKAYRKLALQNHPDKATSESDKSAKQSFFVRLSQAYETLTDPRLKARYDYLLSQGQLEYDAGRDWGDFDVSQGFKRQPMTPTQKAQREQHKAAEAKYREAQEVFRKAQEEAEEFALWTSLAIAGGIALLPAIYMFLQHQNAARLEKSKRKERSSEMKANQVALIALQEEQARQRKAAQEEEREYARQLKRDREEAGVAAAAAEAAHANPTENTDADSWEVVENKELDQPSETEQSDSESEPQTAAKSVIKCALCKKSFKSQQQSGG